MTLESHVTSLALSQRLKELGVKQESLFRWTNEQLGGLRTNGYKWQVDFRPNPFPSDYESYSAFLSSELGEMLKDHIADIRPCNAGWEVRRFKDLGGKEAEYTSAETLADAMALMLIFLLETGIVKNV